MGDNSGKGLDSVWDWGSGLVGRMAAKVSILGNDFELVEMGHKLAPRISQFMDCRRQVFVMRSNDLALPTKSLISLAL